MSVQRDDEFRLRAELALSDLPDDGFTAAVGARVVRHRRRRVRWLAVSSTLVGAAVGLGIVASPAGGLAAVDMSSADTVAVLTLEALCGIIWIGTSSRGASVPPPPREVE